MFLHAVSQHLYVTHLKCLSNSFTFLYFQPPPPSKLSIFHLKCYSYFLNYFPEPFFFLFKLQAELCFQIANIAIFFIHLNMQNKILNMACSFLPVLFFSLISHTFSQTLQTSEINSAFFFQELQTAASLCIKHFAPLTSWFG